MKNTKSQFFSTKKDIKRWLDGYNIKNYTINDDLSVDVNGGVDISNKNLKIIPVKFRKVTGGFWCYHNKLTNLSGSPKTVGSHFVCYLNNLTNLESSPETVGGHFYCDDNKLTSLAGSPKFIDGHFLCENNPLISLVELVDCNFTGNFYFNIAEKGDFKQNKLVKILKKNYNRGSGCYIITSDEFHNKIKLQIEKEILEQKLNKSNNKLKSKNNFI